MAVGSRAPGADVTSARAALGTNTVTAAAEGSSPCAPLARAADPPPNKSSEENVPLCETRVNFFKQVTYYLQMRSLMPDQL